MKILHIVHQYPPEYVGGTEQYTQNLARYQVGQGERVAIFYPSASVNGLEIRLDEPGLRVYRAPAGPRSRQRVFLDTFNQPALSQAFAQTLAAEQPDVVHIQHLMGLPAGIISQLWAANIPYVLTLHDYWFPCANAQLLTNDQNSLCAGPDKWWLNCGRCALARANIQANWLAPALSPLLAYRSRLLRPILQGAGRVIAPTSFIAQLYEQNGFGGDNLVVIPHSIEIPERVLSRPEPEPGRINITFIGSLAWQKGVHILIEAFNQLPPDGFALTIYGNPAVFPDYVAQLQAKAHHPAIHFGGPLDRPAVWRALAAADVVAVPSLWYEVSPLIVMEAFAAGRPLVVSRPGSLASLVREGVDGLTVPAGDVAAWRDTLLRLGQEPGLLAKLAAGIRPGISLAEHARQIQATYHH